MDSNTFAILILGLTTVIICVIIWQIFALARVRAAAAATTHEQQLTINLERRQQQLDQRLTSLVGDVDELGRRIAELEHPSAIP